MIGPVLSLVLLAAYFKALTIFFALSMILMQFLVVKCIYFKGKSYKYLQDLYQPDPYITFTHYHSTARKESKLVLITAILTAWVTPSIVWSNNFYHKSHFLIISSLSSILVHTLCFIFIYIYTSLDEVSFLNFAPITHCIADKVYDSHTYNVTFVNQSFLNIINICNTHTFCPIIQRLCTEDESPTDLLHDIVGPIVFSLFTISFMASIMLQLLGNYFTNSKKLLLYF